MPARYDTQMFIKYQVTSINRVPNSFISFPSVNIELQPIREPQFRICPRSNFNHKTYISVLLQCMNVKTIYLWSPWSYIVFYTISIPLLLNVLFIALWEFETKMAARGWWETGSWQGTECHINSILSRRILK